MAEDGRVVFTVLRNKIGYCRKGGNQVDEKINLLMGTKLSWYGFTDTRTAYPIFDVETGEHKGKRVEIPTLAWVFDLEKAKYYGK